MRFRAIALGVAALAGGLIACPSWAFAPQSPIAAGPSESVIEVLRTARRCGLRQLRIEWRTDPAKLAEAAVYVADDRDMLAVQECLEPWLTEEGPRLKLEPRWYNDTFREDFPGRGHTPSHVPAH